MSFGFGGSTGYGGVSTFGASQKSTTPSSDIMVKPELPDTVHCLSWSPVANFLAAAAWDGQVRVWEVQGGNAVPKTSIGQTAPALGVCWSPDGSKLFHSGCDKAVRMTDLNTNQTTTLGNHDGPVSAVKFASTASYQMVVTSSWDRTLRYWDPRSPNPAMTQTLTERVLGFDLAKSTLVAITADSKYTIYNLQQPQNVFRQADENQLKSMLRCVAVFADGESFVLGSVEGRASVHRLDLGRAAHPKNGDFAFKCHRDATKTPVTIFPVNAFAVYDEKVFATCGGDGGLNTWDVMERHRGLRFDNLGMPTTAAAFSRDRTILAYALGNDWHKGAQNFQQQQQAKIMLHPVQPGDYTIKKS